jgi:hypothetical protein
MSGALTTPSVVSNAKSTAIAAPGVTSRDNSGLHSERTSVTSEIRLESVGEIIEGSDRFVFR